MKLNKKLTGAVGMALITGMLMVSMDAEAKGRGYGRGASGGQYMSVANLPMQELSVEETAGLIKMREEEKLARDVYQVLYAKWNHRIFSNIASSEQQHMDAVKVLLDKYSLVDPVTNSAQGVFADPEMQQLYDSLITQGEQSLQEALKVGATIEDLDIKDLKDLLEQTDNTDIKIVYQNLLKGSRNHMRAFFSQLSVAGITYEAQYLTDAEINDIVSSPRERGRVNENGVQVSGNGKNGRMQGRRMGLQ